MYNYNKACFILGEKQLDPSTVLNKIKDHQPTLYKEEKINKYAVLLPLIEKNDKTHLLFEVRSLNMRSQPGDVCFPGGGVEESDPDEKFSAIRETAEELGISQTDVHDVYPLDIMIPTPERMIYPFVGQLKNNLKLSPNASEVAETFTIPLNYFLQTKPKKYKVSLKAIPEDKFPFHLIIGGKNYDWRMRNVDQYFYVYHDKVIWGLTAKIILNFINLLKI